MQIALLVALIIILVLVATSQIAGSVATAKQAQAQIETARAAELATTGNLVTIITMALIVLLLLALAALAIWAYYRLKIQPTIQNRRAPGHLRTENQTGAVDMGAALNTLLQLKILEALGAQNQPGQSPYLLSLPEEENSEVLWQ